MTTAEKQTEKKLTIALTSRPPVRICKFDWPLVASACSEWWDGEHKSQAFRITEMKLNVRQHEDGRAIVYGRHDHWTEWRNESDTHVKRGVLVDAGSDSEALCQAIASVCRELGEASGDETWYSLSEDCIADLPAHDLC